MHIPHSSTTTRCDCLPLVLYRFHVFYDFRAHFGFTICKHPRDATVKGFRKLSVKSRPQFTPPVLLCSPGLLSSNVRDFVVWEAKVKARDGDVLHSRIYSFCESQWPGESQLFPFLPQINARKVFCCFLQFYRISS